MTEETKKWAEEQLEGYNPKDDVTDELPETLEEAVQKFKKAKADKCKERMIKMTNIEKARNGELNIEREELTEKEEKEFEELLKDEKANGELKGNEIMKKYSKEELKRLGEIIGEYDSEIEDKIFEKSDGF